MAKSFTIDHILYGNQAADRSEQLPQHPPPTRHHHQLLPWIAAGPATAAYPSPWTAAATVPRPNWFIHPQHQPVDLSMMTSLWSGSLHPHHWVPTAGWTTTTATPVGGSNTTGVADGLYPIHPAVPQDGGPFYLGPSAVPASVRLHHHHQPGTRKGGQIRFTHRQSQQLEETFNTTRYLTPSQRRALAGRLALTERQVKTWFQNRRAKWRRARKEGKQMTVPVGQEDEEVSDDEPEDLMLDEEEDEEHQFHHGGK